MHLQVDEHAPRECTHVFTACLMADVESKSTEFIPSKGQLRVHYSACSSEDGAAMNKKPSFRSVYPASHL